MIYKVFKGKKGKIQNLIIIIILFLLVLFVSTYYRVKLGLKYSKQATQGVVQIKKDVKLVSSGNFSIGIRNKNDAEFANEGGDIDFYPQIQPSRNFPKQINTTTHPIQYLHFNATQFEANHGLSFSLVPAYNDKNGTLRIAIDCKIKGNWQEAGSTLLNMTEAGYIDIFPAFLNSGNNDIRLRAVGGTGGTTLITWDQVYSQDSSFSPVWILGNNDESDKELAQDSYNPVFNIDKESVSKFPKEVNKTWYQSQSIDFSLSQEQCQKAAVLSFDVLWNDGLGLLKVAVMRLNGKKWIEIGTVDISQYKPAVMIIPAYQLKEGINKWKFVPLSGSRGTTVVVWDSISLWQRATLPSTVKALLDEILDTSLNYFLSPRVVPVSGLPVTALKVLDRARFGYSNPTEWGYALEAWVVAAERGLITLAQAKDKIENSLKNISRLQDDPNQFKRGVFYPYYKVVDSQGKDILQPYHDDYVWLPSGDCALLYGSLNIVEGWLRLNGFIDVADIAMKIRQNINLRSFYFETAKDRSYISLLVNADTGQLSRYSWFTYADEGGMVGFIAYLSNSITQNEYYKVLDSEDRESRSWKKHYVREAAFFNAMFTWAQRSIIGFPMFGNSKERVYGIQSFLANAESHLDYGDYVKIDYPGFSDAMTQTYRSHPLVGRYTPPNLPNKIWTKAPEQIEPHALAVPFCGLDALDEITLRRLFEKLVLLKCDTSGVWHPKFSQDPFGFEVVASPYMNKASYAGADDGRYIFETLSQAYIVLSIYEGLERYGDKHTFYYFSSQIPGYQDRVKEILEYAYPRE